MSVRVCYLERSERGGFLRGLRLVGLAADQRWPEQPGPQRESVQTPADYDAAARWVRSSLSATRETSSLSLLCLDVDGAVCSWVSSPSEEPSIIATLARQGPITDSGTRAATPVQFYADSLMDSSVQALPRTVDTPGSPQTAQRLAIVAAADVPGRLLIDALDRAGIPVESTASFWQVLARAWDPGAAPQTSDDPLVASPAASVCAVILVDPAGRLLWSWSRAGRMLVGGSIRLPVAALQPAGADDEPGPAPQPTARFGPEEVARLTAEWLTWAAQLGVSPTRAVCIFPEPQDGDDSAPRFGAALGESWRGCAVDVAIHPDPIGATLLRITQLLENSPRKPDEAADPGASMVDLSRRPGRQHRRLYMWAAAALVTLAVLVAALGWRLRDSAAAARTAAAAWESRWRDVLKDIYPDALRPTPGVSPYTLLREELDKQEDRIKPIAKTDLVMPVLEELETLSMVIGNSDYAIENIELDSGGRARLIVIAPSTKDAEELLEALNRISGSAVSEWTATYSERRDGDATRIRGNYNGRWAARTPSDGT